jgi:hypothetical protein
MSGCRRAAIAVSVLIVLGIAFIAWSCFRTGFISYPNYNRIQAGMAIADVERLLGTPAREIAQSDVDNRDGKPAISGDRFFEFGEHTGYGTGYIQISTRGGKVAEKYYFHYSF